MKHVGEIKTISLSPDGSLCVTGAMNYQSTDQNALVWDVPSLSVVGELKGHRDGIYSSAWSPIGGIIATGGGGADHVRLWDATSRRQIGELGRDLFIVYALAFSPDGRFLLTGSANSAPVASVHDGSCFRVWDVRRRKEVARLGVHPSSVQSVIFSSNGRMAACGSSGQFTSREKTDSEAVFCPQTIRLWDITPRFWGIRATERCIELIEHTAWVNSVRLSPNGEYLFTAGRGCFLWEVASGRIVRRFHTDESDYANCGDLSPDGQYVATGSGGQDEAGAPYRNCFVRLWDASTGREIARWKHEYAVTALAFSAGGTAMVAGGHHGELRIWKLPDSASGSSVKVVGSIPGFS